MKPQKNTPALVVSILCAASAAISVLLYFLPICTGKWVAHNAFRLLSPEFVMKWTMIFHSESSHVFFYKVLPKLMYLSILLLLLWAIFSLIRLKFSGIIGIIATVINTIIGSLWCFYAVYYGILHPESALSVTIVPYLMVLFGIGGIVLSILQLTKRNLLAKKIIFVY